MIGALTTDVLVHTWDLARAVGQTAALDEELCARAYAATRASEFRRHEAMIGPEVPISGGRRPSWSGSSRSTGATLSGRRRSRPARGRFEPVRRAISWGSMISSRAPNPASCPASAATLGPTTSTSIRPSGRAGPDAHLCIETQRRSGTTDTSAATSTRTGARSWSTSALMSRHASARSKPSGRTAASPVRSRRGDAIDAEGAQSGVGVGDEVPRRSLRREPERMHDARRRRAVARDVAELDLLAFDHRVLQRVEMLRRRPGRRRAAPFVRVDDDRGRRGLRVGAERFGQRAHELAQRGLQLGRRRRRARRRGTAPAPRPRSVR